MTTTFLAVAAGCGTVDAFVPSAGLIALPPHTIVGRSATRPLPAQRARARATPASRPAVVRAAGLNLR
jgi:hypothetical protein